MRRINYKSDIPPLLLSLKVDENQITVPECDFIVRFYIEGYEGRHYDCSHIGGVWSNCEPSEDGTKLVCYINNQRLGIGELCAEFHYISPNIRYSDGSQKSVVVIGSTELGVELVEDNGDAVTEAAIDVTLPFIYRTAYEIARDHGYTGTAEDFYSALASVVGIADAEKKRVTAEITRNANEQERIENEENRLNAENERVNAEAQRVRYEAIRRDAESDRVEQEEDRKAKFKEITEFIATVRANEGNRESNELERQTNEDTRITEEAKRVEAEKKRAAEFEQQKLDLTGKIDRSGDEMGGDLIFTDNAGVTFRTSDGGAHTMFNDTDDVAKFTADNGDTFEFKQNETPNKNSSAVVVSANLYNALDMTLDSMGSALDGDAAYRAEDGDKIFNPDTFKIQRYNSTIGGFEDLCDPIDGKLYANKMTDYIYRWNTEANKMVFVGGVKAYTKEEADSRFAKLDDATQIVKAKELEANNSVSAKSMWIGDEGLLLGGDGNGHLTVEQDEVITDVTLNNKLATKADDVAYGVEWNNGQPTGEIQETTVKDATKNTTALALFLGQSYNALEQEVEKKADKTELDTLNTSIEQKVDKTDVVQSTGTSETAVMSQKAVSDIVDELERKVNVADEEDITVIEENGKQKLKFADRNYEPLNAGGKGYKILRKNIQTIDGVRKNILTQDMINNPDTIYEIRYDFDLNGAEISIPKDCILKFEGGSLNNGIINLQNNIIEAPKYKIFGLELIIKNSSNIQIAFPEWYGAKGDGISNDFQAFSKTFDTFNTIYLSNRNYVIDCSMKEKVFYINKYIYIKGNANTIVSFKNIGDNSYIFHFDYRGLLIEDVIFANAEKNMKGICLYHLMTNGTEEKKYWSSASNMKLQRCNFEYFNIAVKAISYTNTFSFCKVEHCNIGFYASGTITEDRKSSITNNHFIQCSANYNKIGVHVDTCVYSVFDNCTSDMNGLSYDMSECDAINFISCGMEFNNKLLRLERCTTINFIGAFILIKREGLLADFNKDYISLTNSDSISFEGCKFKFSGSFDNDTEDSIPVIFSINGVYDWYKVSVIIDNTYIINYYKGISLLFDSTSINKVLVLSNKGHSIVNSRFELPAVDDSMSNVTGINTYNLFSCQKNYFFKGRWRDCLGRTVVDVPFGLAASRPNHLQVDGSTRNTDIGYRYYDYEVRGPIYWNGNKWRDFIGVEITSDINRRIGTSEQRKALSMPIDKSYGYLFYDTTLGKYVMWDGRKWIDMNGIDTEKNKKGTSEQKPTLTSKDEGFEYYDTTLKKKIIWNGTEWTNIDGTNLI